MQIVVEAGLTTWSPFRLRHSITPAAGSEGCNTAQNPAPLQEMPSAEESHLAQGHAPLRGLLNPKTATEWVRVCEGPTPLSPGGMNQKSQLNWVQTPELPVESAMPLLGLYEFHTVHLSSLPKPPTPQQVLILKVLCNKLPPCKSLISESVSGEPNLKMSVGVFCSWQNESGQAKGNTWWILPGSVFLGCPWTPRIRTQSCVLTCIFMGERQ